MDHLNKVCQWNNLYFAGFFVLEKMDNNPTGKGICSRSELSWLCFDSFAVSQTLQRQMRFREYWHSNGARCWNNLDHYLPNPGPRADVFHRYCKELKLDVIAVSLAGEFICEVETYGEPISQHNQLEVLGTLLKSIYLEGDGEVYFLYLPNPCGISGKSKYLDA